MTDRSIHLDVAQTPGENATRLASQPAQSLAETPAPPCPKMRAALEAVLALHRGEPYAQGPGYCAECEHQWPCGTYTAVTEALEVEP